jgi:hypothetical protein
MITREYKMNEMGLMGEKYLIGYLSSEGRKVAPSINKYDSEKDLICDGKKVEVKTQVPFIRERALTIKSNQLRKCRNVDELYFITVPAPMHSYKWSGWLFRVNPSEFLTRPHYTKDGRQMILIDIEQEAVEPIHKIRDDIIAELRKYTVSDY